MNDEVYEHLSSSTLIHDWFLLYSLLPLVDQLLIASKRTLGEMEPAKALHDLRVQMPASKDLIRMLGSIVGSIVLLVKRLQFFTHSHNATLWMTCV